MRLGLDGKSAAAGAFAGAALLASLGAMQKDEPPVGRFQVSAAGMNNQITAYVVDTATGKVWWSPQDGQAFLDPKLGRAE